MPPEPPAWLARWCAAALGSPPLSVLMTASHLSQVYAVELSDGRRVVLKARPDDGRVRACWQVQQYLHAQGFPCPRPLAGPAVAGGQLATAEDYIENARPRPVTPAAVPAYAALLRQLIRLAPAPSRCGDLGPAPAWVAWDHDQPGTWPVPDDLDADLNAMPGPALVEETGRRLRARLRAAAGLAPAVGHLDWEAHNLLWRNGAPVAVLDWDSAASRPEAAIAGPAAAVFPALGATVAATVEQTGQFLDAYQAARGSAFTPAEVQIAWAAGAWVLAFNARKEAVSLADGPYQRHLAAEGARRLRLAGA
jgi:aminoglycoside/choline kinase family phosphotransferase